MAALWDAPPAAVARDGRRCHAWAHVRWSPDGRHLLAVDAASDARLYAVDENGNARGAGEGDADSSSDADSDAAAAPPPLDPFLCVPLGQAVRSVSWYPGGAAFAACSRDHPLQLVDALTGRVRATYACKDCWDAPADLTAVAFAPDGKALLVGDDRGGLRVVDAANPGSTAVVHHLPPPRRKRARRGDDDLGTDHTVARGQISCVACAPPHAWAAGERLCLVGSCGGSVGAYDLRADLRAAPAMRMDGHHGGVTSIEFGKDGANYAITAARRDARLLCWDLRSTRGAVLEMARDGGASNLRLGLDVDPVAGRHVVSGRCDGGVSVFDLQASGAEVERHAVCGGVAAGVTGVALHPWLPLLATAAGARPDGAGPGARDAVALWRVARA